MSKVIVYCPDNEKRRGTIDTTIRSYHHSVLLASNKPEFEEALRQFGGSADAVVLNAHCKDAFEAFQFIREKCPAAKIMGLKFEHEKAPWDEAGWDAGCELTQQFTKLSALDATTKVFHQIAQAV